MKYMVLRIQFIIGSSAGKNPLAIQEIPIRFLGREDLQGKG